jgi:AraC family transcriptional regulator
MAPEQSGLTHVLEARCSHMVVLNGRVAPDTGGQRTRPEIEIAVPGERAAAEVTYQTADGVQQCRSVTDKHVCIIPAGQPHQVTWRRCADVTVFLLSLGFVEELARESSMGRVDVIEDYAALDPVIWYLGREVRAELRRHRRLDTTYLESVAMVLARHVLTTYTSSPWPTRESGGLPRYKLRHAVQFIRENIHKDISFHDIAAHLKMSAFHFARMFRHATGDSPHQYIVRCRVNRAKELLTETKLPITDVAFEVGYKTQSHFTTCFGRLVGVTPAAFRAGK